MIKRILSSKKGKIFIAIILLVIALFTFDKVINYGKVDDWQFTPSLGSRMPSISQIIQNMPFTQYWYLYIISIVVLIFLLAPVVIFIKGLIKAIRDFKQKEKRVHALYTMSLGLPTTIILATALLLLYSFEYIVNTQKIFLLYIYGGIGLLAVILNIFSLIRGLYLWIKRRDNQEVKKKGRKKFLFGIYNVIVLGLFVWAFTILVSSLTMPGYLTAPSSNNYGPNSWVSEFSSGSSIGFPKVMPDFSVSYDSSIGFSVGGAKDINSFRENIENDYLPIPTDLTYEGIFYDYYFDTGNMDVCEKLFCPSYTSAISTDPFSEKDEYFLSVGLNSGIQQEDFSRKKLNLVIVLDISGSMSSSFNAYYYDQFGTRREYSFEQEDEKEMKKTKMEIANESVVALLEHLNPEDSFGMVLFDDTSYLAKPLRKIGETDMNAIKGHILDLVAQGGTNMSKGYQEATEQFDDYIEIDSDEYENRIIFLTDAQPNTGDISEEGLFGMTNSNAENKIYTTFIGIGVDFNTELIEKITKIKGANYYSVNSPSQFKDQMDENFEYMVTPLVFDLELIVDAPGFDIEEVYGSPEANEATGEIMKVNTLFPSARVEGETRGGIVLLHMKRVSDDNGITLTASYKDRNGSSDSSTSEFTFEQTTTYYENTGIRKGILLSRYVNLLKNWIVRERSLIDANPQDFPVIPPIETYYEIGIPITQYQFVLGRWERQSESLQVSSEYKELFKEFIPYFESEINTIGDETMSKELEILKKLEDYDNL